MKIKRFIASFFVISLISALIWQLLLTERHAASNEIKSPHKILPHETGKLTATTTAPRVEPQDRKKLAHRPASQPSMQRDKGCKDKSEQLENITEPISMFTQRKTVMVRVGDWGESFENESVTFHISKDQTIEGELITGFIVGVKFGESLFAHNHTYEAFRSYEITAKLESKCEYSIFATDENRLVVSQVLKFKTSSDPAELIHVGPLEVNSTTDFSGVVIGPNGSPVADATIYILPGQVSEYVTICNILAYRHSTRRKSGSQALEDLPLEPESIKNTHYKLTASDSLSARTDSSGRFQVKCRGFIGQPLLIAISDHHQAKIVTPKSRSGIVIQLSPKKRLRLRVEDASGKSIANAKVYLLDQAGTDSLQYQIEKDKNQLQGMIPAIANTNSQGVVTFEAITLPHDYCYVRVFAGGKFQLVEKVGIPSLNQSATISLNATCRVKINPDNLGPHLHCSLVSTSTLARRAYFNKQSQDAIEFPVGSAVLMLGWNSGPAKSVPVQLAPGLNFLDFEDLKLCNCDLTFVDSAGHFIVPDLVAVPIANYKLNFIGATTKDILTTSNYPLRTTRNGYVFNVDLVCGKQLLTVKYRGKLINVTVEVPQEQYSKLTVHLKD